MPMQYTAIFHGCKNDKFQIKTGYIFLIFALTINVLSKNKKNITCFHLKIVIFTALKNLSIVHRRVFVMTRARAESFSFRLIVYQSSCRLSVCLCVCLLTFSNLNISVTSGPIVTILS